MASGHPELRRSSYSSISGLRRRIMPSFSPSKRRVHRDRRLGGGLVIPGLVISGLAIFAVLVVLSSLRNLSVLPLDVQSLYENSKVQRLYETNDFGETDKEIQARATKFEDLSRSWPALNTNISYRFYYLDSVVIMELVHPAQLLSIQTRSSGTHLSIAAFDEGHFQSLLRKSHLPDHKLGNFSNNDPERGNPDAYRFGLISEKTDIYSLGEVIYYIISNGQSYYKEQNSTRLNKYVEIYGDDMSNLLMDTWQIWPELRPSADEVVSRLSVLLENIGPDGMPKRPIHNWLFMKPKIGAVAARGGVCLGGSLNEAARYLRSTHVKETTWILNFNELQRTVRLGCVAFLIHHPKLSEFMELLLSTEVISTSACNDAIDCIDSLESYLPAHALLPPSLFRAVLQMSQTNRQTKCKASGDDAAAGSSPISPLLERVCLGNDMSLDICVPRHLRTAYTVTVYALLGLWEGFQSHGERLFSILLSFNVEKYTVTTKLVEILFQVVTELHGEQLAMETSSHAVNMMGNLLRISHEAVLDAWIGLLSLLLVQLPLSNGNGNILPLPRLLCKFSRELAVTTAKLKHPCMRWEEAIVKSINTFIGLQTGVDARTPLERQLASPMTALKVLHYAVSSTSESAATLRCAAMVSVEKAFQENLLYNFSDGDKKILVQILMEVAERDNSAAVRAAAMQAVQCCPLEVLFTMETQTSSSNMMMRLLNRLCDVGSTVCERAGSVLLNCGHDFIRNTLRYDKEEDTSTLLRRLLVHAKTINQRSDVPVADIAMAILLAASTAGSHVCSCGESYECQKALLLPPSLNAASSSSKPVHICSLAYLDFDFYASLNKLQALDELFSRLTESKVKWERWQLRAGGSSSILSFLGSKRLLYGCHGG